MGEYVVGRGASDNHLQIIEGISPKERDCKGGL